MRPLLLVFLLVGCWSTPRPSGPPALLRRHHATGDVLRFCERGDGTVSVVKEPPITFEARAIHDEHVLAARGNELEVRIDTRSFSIRGRKGHGGPNAMELASTNMTGTPFLIDTRGQLRSIPPSEPEPPSSNAKRFEISFTPKLYWIVDFILPEQPIRRHDRLRVRRVQTVRKANAVPSEVTLDVELVVAKVTPEHVELACTGTQREVTRYGKEQVRMVLTLRCRGWLDRRDGRTSRWWFEVTGALEGSSPDIGGLQLRTHYDVSIGDADPAVCERAAEPGPHPDLTAHLPASHEPAVMKGWPTSRGACSESSPSTCRLPR